MSSPPIYQQPIYLDNAASTPVYAEVWECMKECLTDPWLFANPSNEAHPHSKKAHQRLVLAKQEAADALGVSPDCLCWTSGATESNAWLIQHMHQTLEAGPFLTTPFEHPSIDLSLKATGRQVIYVQGHLKNGCAVLKQDLEEALQSASVRFVSVVHANGDTGVINDIEALAGVCRERGILFHTDATQSAGKIPLPLDQVDFLSLSAHKFGGPKGVGLLYTHPLAGPLLPMIHGKQQRGQRGGTEPLHQIVGAARAMTLSIKQPNTKAKHLQTLRDHLESRLRPLPGFRLLGEGGKRLPSHLNVAFDGVPRQELLRLTPHISVLGASACSAFDASLKGIRPQEVLSPVLLAMYGDETIAKSALRFAFGHGNTMQEAEAVGVLIGRAVQRIQAIRRWETKGSS